MPSSCFCPGCRTGLLQRNIETKKNGESFKTLVTENREKISLFKAPKDPELFALWQKSIPRADRKLSRHDLVCAKHFKKEDIVSYFEEKLSDGTVWRMEKGKITLRRGAIPCIFSNVPGHSTYLNESKIWNKKSFPKRKNHSQSGGRKRFKELSVKPNIAELAVNEVSHSSNENDTNSIDFPVEEPNTLGFKDIQNVQNERLPNQSLQKPLLNQSKNLPFAVKSSVSSSYKNDTNSNDFPVEGPNTSSSKDIQSVQNEICPSQSFQKCLPNQSKILKLAADIELLNKNASDQLKTVLSNNIFAAIENNNISRVLCDVESQQDEEFSFSFLRDNVNKIKKITSRWTIGASEDFIICTRWNSTFALERKIVIFKDLKVKVFLKEIETSLESDLQLESIKDVSELISRIELIRICDGLSYRGENCLGILHLKRSQGLCANCLKHIKKTKVFQPLEVPKDQIELIKFNII